MYDTLQEKIAYNAEDLRGIAGKLEREDDRVTVLMMTNAIEHVASRLENFALDVAALEAELESVKEDVAHSERVETEWWGE